jgi:GMP synthase (glutamine-hydrolysing)
MSKKTAAVIRHVHFEDLGTFAEPLSRAGYDFQYFDAGVHGLPARDPAATGLLIVLGAPVGVYEEDKYPFLRDEIALLKARLSAGQPTFGICLGAQLVARTLGARVYPSGIKEIGWGPVDLTDAASTTPLRHLAGTTVLHWHGDTFDPPRGAVHLASTAMCRNKAFSSGSNILCVQFHPEVDQPPGSNHGSSATRRNLARLARSAPVRDAKRTHCPPRRVKCLPNGWKGCGHDEGGMIISVSHKWCTATSETARRSSRCKPAVSTWPRCRQRCLATIRFIHAWGYCST